jgi:hypothetical protein
MFIEKISIQNDRKGWTVPPAVVLPVSSIVCHVRTTRYRPTIISYTRIGILDCFWSAMNHVLQHSDSAVLTSDTSFHWVKMARIF